MKKLVVTNRAALAEKYGSGLAAVDAALDRLVAADLERRVITEVVDLGGEANDPRSSKEKIDDAVTTSVPDFLLILGAADVVPHQDLVNPVRGTDDPDDSVPSDLPYACSAPYSRDPAAFLAPALAVGRIPDVAGSGGSESDFARLIEHAASWRSRDRIEYADPFSLAAKAWERSTALSLLAAFRSNAGLATSPARGPEWSDQELAKRSYFINCHGESDTPKFFGESADGTQRPVAIATASLERHVSDGAVAAIECSYAGEQYGDSFTSAFLQNGGYGCFVSTTAAYGSADTSDHADILCQQFMRNVLDGMTLGHAALNARLSFVRTYPLLGPIDLKTLAQFYLAGDPAIQAVGELATRVRVAMGASSPIQDLHAPAVAVTAERAMGMQARSSHRK